MSALVQIFICTQHPVEVRDMTGVDGVDYVDGIEEVNLMFQKEDGTPLPRKEAISRADTVLNRMRNEIDITILTNEEQNIHSVYHGELSSATIKLNDFNDVI